MTPQQYCLAHAPQRGSTRYYSLLHTEKHKRDALACLDAWVLELEQTVLKAREPEVASQKLRWWNDEIQRCFAGEAQHPVAQQLSTAVQQWNLPMSQFQEVIDGYQMDLDGRSCASDSELALYLQRTGATPALMTSEILGYQRRETLTTVTRLGASLRQFQRLAAIHPLVQQGLLPFSADRLESSGIGFDAFRTGVTGNEVKGMLCEAFGDNKREILAALRSFHREERLAQSPHLVAGKIALATINEIERDGCHLLEHSIDLTPLRKLIIAWKTHFCLALGRTGCV